MGKNPINLALRFLLELAGLAIFAVWGWNWGSGWRRFFPAVFVPLVFAALWGIFAVDEDPSRSGKTVVPTKGVIRLLLELLFFALAILALFDLGFKIQGFVFMAAVVFHYAISYDRIAWLLKH